MLKLHQNTAKCLKINNLDKIIVANATISKNGEKIKNGEKFWEKLIWEVNAAVPRTQRGWGGFVGVSFRLSII